MTTSEPPQPQDAMLRQFLETAARVSAHRKKYLLAGPARMASFARRNPLLHKLVCWLKLHSSCSPERLLEEAHRLASNANREMSPQAPSGSASGAPAQQTPAASSPSSAWELYIDGCRRAPDGDALISACRSACGDTFLHERENLTQLYRRFKPKEIGCLGSGCLNDVPVEVFLRGGSRVCLVDWIPGISEKSFAFGLIRPRDTGYACLLCNLPGGGAKFCKNFKAPARSAHVCDNFCLLEGDPPRCTRYETGVQPRFLAGDATLGRATSFAAGAERIVASANSLTECFQSLLQECRRFCWTARQTLDIPDGKLDFVSSVMVMSQFEHEPYEFFSKLLVKRFGQEQILAQEESLRPLMEELRAELFRMQIDGHVREMYRLVNKKRGHVYFSVELFEKHPERKDFFLAEGTPFMLETLGNYFFFDLEALPLDRTLRRVDVGKGHSVIQSYLLTPAPRPRPAA
ncbi:MAG: hypothetical protein LAN71_08980 [Acidobacteriia bacterium]|nr:hypothetical protein [Terriglobia bacterium]